MLPGWEAVLAPDQCANLLVRCLTLGTPCLASPSFCSCDYTSLFPFPPCSPCFLSPFRIGTFLGIDAALVESCPDSLSLITHACTIQRIWDLSDAEIKLSVQRTGVACLCCAGSGKQQQQPARFNQPISFVSSGVVGCDPMEIRPALQRVTQVMPDQAQPAEPMQTPNITEAGQGE